MRLAPEEPFKGKPDRYFINKISSDACELHVGGSPIFITNRVAGDGVSDNLAIDVTFLTVFSNPPNIT
jgi:hypothetical protein